MRSARVSVVLAFWMHGAISGSLGPRIPALKERSGLTTGALGIPLAGLAVGLFVGTRLAGPPIRRFGSRPVVRVGTPAMGVALMLVGLARDVVALTAAFVALGVLGGLLDVAVNDNAVAVERGYARPILSSIHGMWSVGLLMGSAGGAVAAALNASPVLHFGLVALVVGLGSVWALARLLPADASAFRRSGEEHRYDRSPERALRAGPVLALGLVAFSSFLGEGASADWSVVYLRENLGAGPGLAGTAFVAYSAGMVAVRFVADGLSARFGPVRVVRTCGLAAAVGLSCGLLVPAPGAAIAGFAMLGASLGPIVPVAFSAAGNTALGAGSALGWVVTMGYLGTVVGPVLIGGIATAVGLRAALVVPVALGLAASAAAGSVRGAAGGDRTKSS
jgi:MFS family permease